LLQLLRFYLNAEFGKEISVFRGPFFYLMCDEPWDIFYIIGDRFNFLKITSHRFF